MFFSKPIQCCYHSHADPIWPDGTFKQKIVGEKKRQRYVNTYLIYKEKKHSKNAKNLGNLFNVHLNMVQFWTKGCS
jgi:hypothetical protein